MRYHYEKPTTYLSAYGETYFCDHPVYSDCTLYLINDKGLAVIQQRFNSADKSTIWGRIDPWLTDIIYLHPKFKDVFDKRSGECTSGLYPAMTIRQMM